MKLSIHELTVDRTLGNNRRDDDPTSTRGCIVPQNSNPWLRYKSTTYNHCRGNVLSEGNWNCVSHSSCMDIPCMFSKAHSTKKQLLVNNLSNVTVFNCKEVSNSLNSASLYSKDITTNQGEHCVACYLL